MHLTPNCTKGQYTCAVHPSKYSLPGVGIWGSHKPAYQLLILKCACHKPARLALPCMRSMVQKHSCITAKEVPSATSTSQPSISFINMTGPVKSQELFKKNQEHEREGSRRTTEQVMPKETEFSQDIEENLKKKKCYYCFQGNLGEYCIHKQEDAALKKEPLKKTNKIFCKN